jgi:transketolase
MIYSEDRQLSGDRSGAGAGRTGAFESGRPPGGSLAAQARVKILDTLHAKGGGHFGGACSVVEILEAILTAADIRPDISSGDILILSKGHSAVAYYALLDLLGLASFDLTRYGDSSARVEIHPCEASNPWVHFSTGSLGQGLAYGVGAALATGGTGRQVWVVLGDGECQEGQIWEAADLAARYRLSNLNAIVDCNGQQECGWPTLPPAQQAPLLRGLEKWGAFGWSATTINGHSATDLRRWILGRAEVPGAGPRVALAHTVKGSGIPCLEEDPASSHCTSLSEENYLAARRAILGAQTR